eukprot:CAMPEP_0194496740 /NCGR_PEP_ID=MMETSP0253-20130528/13909_1 /TAXON_ID=2966 /ORGANISM="Noctiluca scintillans" /LENGTH=232 /DNA_ID=CAMNT_0039338169 /DNA_START=896 /DNA_END=1594 /DNA_ORIENTATION=-
MTKWSSRGLPRNTVFAHEVCHEELCRDDGKERKIVFLCHLTGVKPLSPPPSEAFGNCCHLDALHHRKDSAFTDPPTTGENRNPHATAHKPSPAGLVVRPGGARKVSEPKGTFQGTDASFSARPAMVDNDTGDPGTPPSAHAVEVSSYDNSAMPARTSLPLLLKDARREPTGGAEIGSAPSGTGTSAIDRARAAPPRRWVRRFLACGEFCTCGTSCISACSCNHCVFLLSSST